MVIGSGLMAKTFASYKNSKEVLIFASGVSNSTETDSQEFLREFNLLKKTIATYPDFKLIYFSTLSIEDKAVQDRPYIKHKLLLENYIKKNVSRYLIARVSNVVGPGGNSHTIINYFVNAIKNEERIEVWQLAERNIIGNKEVKFITDALLMLNIENRVINIASNKSLLVTEIVSEIELFLKKKANAIFIPKGNILNIDVSEIASELAILEQKHGKGVLYLRHLLNMYYNHENCDIISSKI